MNFRHIQSIGAIAVIAFIGTACSTSKTNQFSSGEQSQLEAAWVVVGEQGQPTARVITRSATCPILQQDGVNMTMQVRAQPATEAPRATDNKATEFKPVAFPVLTCELPLKRDVASVSVVGRKLPVPIAVPLKIVVIGDTGCRVKPATNSYQACNDEAQWAFSTVAKTAASFEPDLVIHVGDYHYREGPCPAGEAGCAGSPWGYGWDTWQADFFAPAAPLLAAAPWVMTRGNHEICSRSGQGWWRFMDPRVLQSQRNCNVAADDQYGDFSAPYAVPIGAGSQLIVFDSAKVPEKPVTQQDPAHRIYLDQLKAANQLAKQANDSLFVVHHPVLGFAVDRKNSDQAQFVATNLFLQNLLENIHPKRLFAENVSMILAGHVHLFEAITFSTHHPTQLVIGNGGTALDKNLPAKLPQHITPFAKAKIAQLYSTNRFGFTTLERTSANATNWVIKSWDQNGVLMNTCHVNGLRSECS